MQHNFSFNPDRYDLWPIYEAIKKYYPIGIGINYEQGRESLYLKYPGIKEIERIVVENIHDRKNYQERWLDFTNEIGLDMDKKIIGTTFGQAPSFSSSIILEENRIKNVRHSKELHFSVSLLGNFFQIYGVDEAFLETPDGQGAYSTTLVTTASPFEEFKTAFEFVQNKIQTKYPKHLLIPFKFGQMVINGLRVRYTNDQVCSVNMALFNDFLSKENRSYFIKGDEYFGAAYWLRP